MNVDEIRQTSEIYKILYRGNQCSREVAKENIQPYLDLVNEKSKELAKKYNQKTKIIGFSEYVR